MLFSRNLFAALLAVAAVNAIPSPHSKKHDDPNIVFYCTSENWNGHCNPAPFVPDQCEDLHDVYDNNVHSFGPPPGARCDFYGAYKCGGDGLSISYPGTGKLEYEEWTYSGFISSYRCYRN